MMNKIKIYRKRDLSLKPNVTGAKYKIPRTLP